MNALLTRLKKDSQLYVVIMELSWPNPCEISANGSTPVDTYLGHYRKMHMPIAKDMVSLIQEAGKKCYSTAVISHMLIVSYHWTPVTGCWCVSRYRLL